MKPNIFNIATKELHQDAFITWLLQYADNKYQVADEQMNACGKIFIKKLICKVDSSFDEEIISVKAGRQWENIDVWAEINSKYLIIIEDKTNTSHHSNQLQRYKNTAEKWCSENNFELPICIYLKTGNESQSNLSNIIKQGFSIFSRKDFIEVLHIFKTSTNNIFLDFFDRLTYLEKSNNEFETKIISEWNGNDWQGFFQFLEKHDIVSNWDWVNNKSGGFWNAIMNWNYWGCYPFYIQLEEGKLCFKVSTDPNDVDIPKDTFRNQIRNNLYQLIMVKANEFGFTHIRKPNRFGNGKYMTVAIVDSENWLGSGDSLLNKEMTKKILNDYLYFLEKIIA